MAYDIQELAIEPVVDGIIDMLKVNLIANTTLAFLEGSVRHDEATAWRIFDVVWWLRESQAARKRSKSAAPAPEKTCHHFF